MACRYLGLYEEEVDAAKAYDVEAIKRRGVGAVTNFDLSSYLDILGMLQLGCRSPCLFQMVDFRLGNRDRTQPLEASLDSAYSCTSHQNALYHCCNQHKKASFLSQAVDTLSVHSDAEEIAEAQARGLLPADLTATLASPQDEDASPEGDLNHTCLFIDACGNAK